MTNYCRCGFCGKFYDKQTDSIIPENEVKDEMYDKSTEIGMCDNCMHDYIEY